MSMLDELAAAIPGSRIRTIGGRETVIVDILNNESVDVFEQPDHEPYVVVQSVLLLPCGRAEKIVLAVTYGVGLIPALVGAYRELRESQVKA